MAGAGVTSSPRTLQHDTKGNMTLDDRGTGMAWDFDNMLQTFSANGVSGLSNATYEYDAIGRRVAKNVAQSGGGTATTVFVQAGQQVTCEYAPGNAVTDCDRKYAYGTYIDEVLNFIDATAASEVRYWTHSNRQYSVYTETTAAGTATEFYRYDLYGKNLCVSPSGLTLGIVPEAGLRVTFTGRFLDSKSSTHFFRSRIYESNVGRFLQRDKAAYSDGQSQYTAYFVPDRVDPLGTKCWDVGKPTRTNAKCISLPATATTTLDPAFFNVTINPSPIGLGPSAALICRRLCQYTVITKCTFGGWCGLWRTEAISSRTFWQPETAILNTEGGANAKCGVHCISLSVSLPLPVDLPVGIEFEVLSNIAIGEQGTANGCCRDLAIDPSVFGYNETIWKAPEEE